MEVGDVLPELVLKCVSRTRREQSRRKECRGVDADAWLGSEYLDGWIVRLYRNENDEDVEVSTLGQPPCLLSQRVIALD
jgi:hypothetical protein